MAERRGIIRRYRPGDRQAVRDICAATGLLGESISYIFPDHDFFVDFLTCYYTDIEPESAMVVETDGMVVGYLLGCTDLRRYLRCQACLLCKVLLGVMKGFLRSSYGPLARRFFLWLLWRGWREVPKAPAEGAHFHFNILKPWREAATTRKLVETFLDYLRLEHPRMKIVWGQMETFGARRSLALFRRLGWEFYDQIRFGKYKYLFGSSPPPFLRKIATGEVFLTTICYRLKADL